MNSPPYHDYLVRGIGLPLGYSHLEPSQTASSVDRHKKDGNDGRWRANHSLDLLTSVHTIDWADKLSVETRDLFSGTKDPACMH